MERKEGLKPCVFCGRTNQRFLMDMDIYEYPQNRGRRAIICDCGLRLYARDHKEAEEKWQNRLYDEYIKGVIEDNERLRADNKRMNSHINRLKQYDEERDIALHSRLISETRADTVRMMQERLRAVAYQSGDWSHGEHPMVVELDDIDQIAEEMIGGKDVNKED